MITTRLPGSVGTGQHSETAATRQAAGGRGVGGTGQQEGRGPAATSVRRRVTLTWGLLVLNVLPFYTAPHLLPIPTSVGKVIPQLALACAFLLALSVNRRAAVRPSFYMLLLLLLVGVALVSSLGAEFIFGTTSRACRLALFVITIWLLAPFWGRRDLMLVKAHLTVVWVVIGSIVLGLLVAPGYALQDGRLAGGIWPVPPTQVGRYAAVGVGLTLVLWLSGKVRKEFALLAAVIGVPVLLLSHTRTALVALVAGLVIAGLSLFRTRARVRRVFAAGLVVVSIGALTLSTVVATWLARGQDEDQLTALTGRTAVWQLVLDQPRTVTETLFGFGLSNKSFDGLAIDSNWMATYYDLGLTGVVLNAAMLVFLLVAAAFRPHGAARALALFLVAFSVVSSFTETGLGDASLALLELTLAASLLLRPVTRGPR